MQAELIFTGTELLLGYTLNTNAQFLSKRLAEMGIEVIQHTTVGDDWDHLADVLRHALKHATLIIISGGLGPTSDDLTKEIVADVLGVSMFLHEPSLSNIQKHFESRQMEMPQSNIKQAFFPMGAEILPNLKGTASGALLKRNEKVIVLLPGPPIELSSMFENSVVPYLANHFIPGLITKSKILKLTGIAESVVQDRLKDLENEENTKIGYVTKPGEVNIRITGQAASSTEAKKMVANLAEKVHSRLEEYIFAYDEELLEEIVSKLLIDKGLSIAVAESCTGGLIATRLTDIPGSSSFFLGGIVAYHNEFKANLLGVSTATLEYHGAVSKETAIEMAQGIRKKSGASLGLSVTGIAGPSGGSSDKPVGLVFIALATNDKTLCREFRFPGRRRAVRQGAANSALNMLRQHLLNKQVT